MGNGKINVGFMPPLLPDELLYSLLGRIVALNALGTPKQCLRKFFGSSNVIPSPDLPTRLEYFHEHLGPYSPVASSTDLIEVGTLYPYHRPFLQPERDVKVTQLLLRGEGKGLKALLGRLANRFQANVDLRYCANCVREDVSSYGAPYWHRSHQLPGVVACRKHKTRLQDRIKNKVADEKQHFFLVNCEEGLHTFPEMAAPHQVEFAVLSEALLNASLPALNPTLRSLTYVQAIRQLGLCKKGRVQYSDLATELRKYYVDFEGFRHRERLLSTQKTPLAWIRPLIERPGRACHPICHLILIEFLFESLEGFLTAFESTAIEEPPPVSIHMAARTSHRIEHETFYRNTRLSCNDIARITGKSVTTVVSKRRALGVKISSRRKYLDEDLLTNIADLLKSGRCASEVASICNVSLSTVYRVRQEKPSIICAGNAIAEERERAQRRRQWQTALETHLGMGIKAARSAAPATYAWLRRHDHQWLQKSYAEFRNCRANCVHVDWARRDQDLCAHLKKVAAELWLSPGRFRISRSLLTRQIGEASFRVNEHRLPQLRHLIDSLEESPLSYELRRLDMAVQDFYLARKQLSLWRIRRAAGIRNWTETHAAYARWRIKKIAESV